MIENQTSTRNWASLLRISKSQIQTYLICPRKFFFQYVMGAMPEFLPAALPFGTALHGAVAAFYRAIKETGVKPDLGFIIREFEVEWARAVVGHRMSFKAKMSADSHLALGKALLQKFYDEVQPRKVEAVEYPFAIPLSDPHTGESLDVSLVGIIDLIESDDEGNMIIADGKMHLLPFDGLKNPQGKYVLESHVVTYAPSATVLNLLRTARRSDLAELNFLGVGGVSYSTKRIASVDRGPEGADFFGIDPVAFSNLPGSRQEVTSIAGMVPGPSKILVDATATEGNFKSQALSGFRVIHLALHGVASPQFPDRAALVLGNSGASGEDGLLQAREIRDLDLRADLVVLSACETGSGTLLGEEGIASLERAFLLAGAKSVIASLWTADDTYTIALMKRLYRHLVDGADEGVALRQAKLDLLKEFGDQALPIYWAGFTLVGDGSTSVFK